MRDSSSDELSASVLSVTMTDALVEEDLLNDYPITAENKVYFDWIAGLKEDGALVNRKDAIKRLDAAGVTILVGSDGGNFAVFQGVGFHREMYFLQQMGMSPWDIVLGSTYSAYDFLDVDWGIKEGRPANFTLHHRRIFEDLGLSAKVKAIYLNGRWVQREPLLDYATPDFFQYIKLFFGFEV